MAFKDIRTRGIATKVAVGYGAFGVAWIYFSDRAIEAFVHDPESLSVIQTYKGFGYVAITALLLYLTLRAYLSEIQRVHEGMEQAEREIVERLSMAAEFRDDESGNHARRVGFSCEAIGRALGLSEPEAKALGLAALLHDVGKIGIPDSVILKCVPFDDEDRRIMEGHTIIGGSLLAAGASPVLQMAERIALTHHERWDGSGYPFGLTGQEIPIEGRICAVADVFDALLTERRYKPGWSLKDALAEIESQSGSQFDPKVVSVFRDVVEDVMWNRERHPEPGEAPIRYREAA